MVLTDNEFRVLAYVRAYADHSKQHLDPNWVQGQLEFSFDQMRSACHGLVAKGLAEFFEYEPSAEVLLEHPEVPPGLRMCDICLTEKGWNHLRPSALSGE